MIAIVIVGYNRVQSLKRTFESVEAAFYPDNLKVDIVFSIDYSGKEDVINYVQGITWGHGQKIIKAYNENLGLRKHVMSCGNYLDSYDAVIVLEDDIVVAEGFIEYAIQAVEFYKNDYNIAGIALYSHALCQPTLYRFQPMKTVYDVYLMKYAASWGQIWLKKQFKEFLTWYENESDESIKNIEMPEMVKQWPKSSWLKFHTAYCSKNNKYYVYPYNALSTDYSEAGEHYKKKSDVFQVELQKGHGKKYNFCHNSDKYVARYDSFFENEELYEVLKDYFGLCLNLNGIREQIPEKYNYCLSTTKIDKKVLKEYGLSLRPIEENVINDISGRGIALYDMKKAEKNRIYKEQSNLLWSYYARGRSLPKYLTSYIMQKIRARIRHK